MTEPSTPASAHARSTSQGLPPSDFIRDFVEEDLKSGRFTTGADAVSARAQRLPAHRPCQGNLHLDFGIAEQFGGKCNLRFDDTNPDQGRAGIRRRHQARTCGGWASTGKTGSSSPPTISSSSTSGPSSSSGRARHTWRPERAGDPRVPGDRRRGQGAHHRDPAGSEQPLPQPLGGGEPGPVPPDAGRGVRRRGAHPAGQDRHGAPQPAHARSRDVPHPPRHAPPHRRTRGASIPCTISSILSRTPSRGSRTPCAAWSTRSIAPVRLVPGATWGSSTAGRSSLRG